MQLFPRLPFFLQNASVRGLLLETEGSETVAIIRAASLCPIDIGDDLHFDMYALDLTAPLEIYHGDKLIHTQSGGAGPFTIDYTTTSSANYFEFRSEGAGVLVEMLWPSITKA